MKKFLSSLYLIVILIFILQLGCQQNHTKIETSVAENLKGIHGGRLLTKGNFAIELKIFETGVAPQFRAYAYSDGKPLSPKDFNLEVKLTRLGGKITQFKFHPTADFLVSDTEVSEPHSFDVAIEASYNGNIYNWSYDSLEGRTVMPDSVAKLSGVKTTIAKLSNSLVTLPVWGILTPTEHSVAHIIPRFSGVVRSSFKQIGSKVKKGEVVAIIESNESLQPYEVRSQISGTITEGHTVVGEYIAENQEIYTVVNHNLLSANIKIPIASINKVKLGQEITITAPQLKLKATSKINYIAKEVDSLSQTLLVKANIPNAPERFIANMVVKGEIAIDELKNVFIIPQKSIQKFRDWDVIFQKVGDSYEIVPITISTKVAGGYIAETGLTVGIEYVTNNSYLIKADIMKSGASHDH
jgi:membrane fusion protein, heavy metal efflux system